MRYVVYMASEFVVDVSLWNIDSWASDGNQFKLNKTQTIVQSKMQCKAAYNYHHDS